MKFSIAHSVQSMNSQQIAELVNSRHDSVKRTIERLVEQEVITLPPMVETSFKDKLGKTQYKKVYVFSGEQGKLDSITVVAQLCPHFTAQIVKRWQELENQTTNQDNQAINKLKQALIDNNPRWQMIYKMAQINMSQRQMAGAMQISDSTVYREYAKMKELGLLPTTTVGQLCLEV